MINFPLKTARFIYRITPFKVVRNLYFQIYCSAVRKRKKLTTINGVSYQLDLGEVIDLALYLGEFEVDIVEAIENYCKPGMIVFDVGANIGAHTFRFARAVGGNGRVYAFEPTQYAYQKLSINIALNSFENIFHYRLALANRSSSGELADFRASWRTDGGRIDSQCLIDFMPLDDWRESHDVERVDLIKIDVDGAEFGVLEGGWKTITKFNPIIFIEAIGMHFSVDATNPFLLLERAGYTFVNLKNGEDFQSAYSIGQILPENDVEISTSINVLALPNRLARQRNVR